MTITPVVYVGFLLQKTGLNALSPPAVLDGCGLSFASVLLNSLLNPSQDVYTRTFHRCKGFTTFFNYNEPDFLVKD